MIKNCGGLRATSMMPKKQLTLFGFYQLYSRSEKSSALFDSLIALKSTGAAVSGAELASLISNGIRFKTRKRRFSITQYKIDKVLYQYGMRLSKRLRELVDSDSAKVIFMEFNNLDVQGQIECIEHLKSCGFISDEEFYTGTF
ncbi:hypothetical protein OTK49_02290 [Vibrio coralliirubri]|uniref:hypothetical protein n=1 Tax=Vibrio coralliirubri TaxID=1516159 RepID=UPI0022840BE1|nr:hypothetical protein [Vibrio coralliirubri]MCY9861345.1 hypothetical protein [Vibrio coralliirubri]